MIELMKYNKQNELVEVVEFNEDGSVLTLHSLRGDRFLLRYWNQEVDGEKETFLEHVEYKESCKLTTMRMDGYRWTRAVKSESIGLDYAEVKDRVTTCNGELIAMKIKENFLESWKEKITTKTI